MKIKSKFTIYNIIMLLAPIITVGMVSVVFLIIFILKFPVEELNLTRAMLLSPKGFSEALGEFFKSNPSAIGYALLWLAISVGAFAASTTIITHLMSRSIETPINELSRAAEKIRGGDLDFEVMGCGYDEIDNLCGSFDSMRRELKYSRERERAMREERSLLLANLSHDLKTPITSIEGYIDGIRDGVADTPEKLEKYLDTIYAKAKTIDDLVNNLSTFSKLDMSPPAFKFERTDINAFLRGFIDDCRLDLEKYKITLRTDIPSEYWAVKIDRERMRRVFSNLIDNAVKYRREENPVLEIKTALNDGGVYVYISDNGIGIEESELESAFESFRRADSSRSVAGSGLGLGIVREITEKHGGKVWLTSGGLGKGTTATVYLSSDGGANKN